eukprot:gene7565-biopygen16563
MHGYRQPDHHRPFLIGLGWAGCDGVTATGAAPLRDRSRHPKGHGRADPKGRAPRSRPLVRRASVGDQQGSQMYPARQAGVAEMHRSMSEWMEHRQQGARMSTDSSPSPRGSPKGRCSVGG